MKTMQFLGVFALSLFAISGRCDDRAWVIEEEIEVRLVEKGSERQIVDTEGRILVRMHSSETVRQSIYTSAKDAVVLRTAFQRDPVIGPGSVFRSYAYSRLILVRRVGGRTEAIAVLAYNSPFMMQGTKFVKEIVSVGEGARSITAIIGKSVANENTSYEKRTIRLSTEEYIE